MKHYRSFLCAMLMSGSTFSGLHAQSALNLNEKSGTQTSYTLSSINKLTFAEGKILILKKDGAMDEFPLTGIRNLHFGIVTSVEQMIPIGKSRLMLYPNPVRDQLNIQYESTTNNEVQFQIIDLLGKVVFQETFSNRLGTNRMTFSVEQIKPGLYFCRLHNGDKQEVGKFLKN